MNQEILTSYIKKDWSLQQLLQLLLRLLMKSTKNVDESTKPIIQSIKSILSKFLENPDTLLISTTNVANSTTSFLSILDIE